MYDKISNLFENLWPLNRSLTGQDNLKTLEIINSVIDLQIKYIASGTNVYDWIIPDEWNVNDAYVADSDGNKVIDFKLNNLHLMGYSEPVNQKVELKDLKEHLYTLPEFPTAIPYITSYYEKRWGFCLSYNQYLNLKNDIYTVFVDSSFNSKGKLVYATSEIKGASKKKIFFSTYICHPSMANNEISGMIVSTYLCKYILEKKKLKFSYLFSFAPETIGALVILNEFEKDLLENLVAGYVVTCVGDSGDFTYKKSRDDESYVNKISKHVLKHLAKNRHKIEDFIPMGSDERQYCSPGFNLPVGSLMRTMYGNYPEYHTSLDNKDFISFAAIEETINIYIKIIECIEFDGIYLNTSPYGEPQLGKRGLYPTVGLRSEKAFQLKAILYLLNFSDGRHTLLDIAEKLGCFILDLEKPLNHLLKAELLKEKKDIYET